MKLQPQRFRPPEMNPGGHQDGHRIDEFPESDFQFIEISFVSCSENDDGHHHNHHHHHHDCHHQHQNHRKNHRHHHQWSFRFLNFNNFNNNLNSIIVVLLIIMTKLCSSSSTMPPVLSNLYRHHSMLRHHHHHNHHHHHYHHQHHQNLPLLYQQQPPLSVGTTTGGRSHHHHHRQYYHHASPFPVSFTPTASASSSSVWRQMAIRSRALTRRHRHPYYHYYDDDGEKEDVTLTTTTTTTTTEQPVEASKISKTKVIYQNNWIKSDEELPVCELWQVCNKIDTYSTPWIEKQCRCETGRMSACSTSFDQHDDYTVVDKTKQYKLCEPVKQLPTCKYFRDITWTITTTSWSSSSAGVASNENITRQEMKCQCPPNSVAYILKHQVYRSPDMAPGQLGYRYHFACSPETKLRCKRKEPCRLFMSRKRPSMVEEVTPSTLCQCGQGYHCPGNHHHASVLLGTVYPLDNVRTYSGYCYPDKDSQQDTESTDVADQS